MSHRIEGNNEIGFRVIDEESGLPLTGRKPTAQAALDAAGIVEVKTTTRKKS